MRIIVIGGGAAGMMAAIQAAERGAEVTLLERNNRCGIKLNLTGKGRCNLTNDCETDVLVKNTLRGGKSLYSAFAAFTPRDAMAFFADLGVETKVERGGRVFPLSDNAKDISGALISRMKRLGVTVLVARAKGIKTEEGRVMGVLTEPDGQSSPGFLPADKVILCTGGLSYPRTGSTGDGYRLAAGLGHTVTPPRQSLVPLCCAGEVPARLEGLSLRNIEIGVQKNGKVLYTEFGEMVFTALGVSGPVILSASAVLGPGDFPCELRIDLKPALDEQTLDRRLLRDFEENANRDFVNALGKLLPAKLIPEVIRLSGVPERRKVNEITKEQRAALRRAIKAFPLTLTGYGPVDEAVVTAGGVSMKEISPKTMESKLVKGLYFAGEVIDVDAFTGGFNLQIAWSTGFLAGRSAADMG